MEDLPLDVEEAGPPEEYLHRLDDALRLLQAQYTLLAEDVLAVTGRLYRLEQSQSEARPFTERR